MRSLKNSHLLLGTKEMLQMNTMWGPGEGLEHCNIGEKTEIWNQI